MRNGAFAAPVLLIAVVLSGCVTDRPESTRAARLRGTLWWVTPEEARQPVEVWKPELDAIQAMGMDLLVLNGPFVGTPPEARSPDTLAALFVEAGRRNMGLYIDTLAAPSWWTLEDPRPEIDRARARVEDLARRYGHYAAFEGWYIPYELYVFWGAQAELIRTLYAEIAAACKAATPGKPVLISPFFILDNDGVLGDFRWAAPDEYEAFWSGLLRDTAIDIVALQDSGEHLSCYSFEQRRPFFEAMKAACAATGKTLWANLETGELEVNDLEDYARRFGRKTHVNDPKTAPFWRAVSPEKLEAKLGCAGTYTDTAVTWGYREFLRPSAENADESSFAQYCAIIRKSGHAGAHSLGDGGKQR